MIEIYTQLIILHLYNVHIESKQMKRMFIILLMFHVHSEYFSHISHIFLFKTLVE